MIPGDEFYSDLAQVQVAIVMSAWALMGEGGIGQQFQSNRSDSFESCVAGDNHGIDIGPCAAGTDGEIVEYFQLCSAG